MNQAKAMGRDFSTDSEICEKGGKKLEATDVGKKKAGGHS